MVDLLANDTDPDGDPMTVTAATLANAANRHACADAGTVVWTFTPAAGFTGNAVITYTVTDQDGATSTSTHTVTVGNAPPVLGSDHTGRPNDAPTRQSAGARHRQRAADLRHQPLPIAIPTAMR